jgi:hypothetical protein
MGAPPGACEQSDGLTRVLLRTHVFDAPTKEFLSRLQSESGHLATCVFDETKSVEFEKLQHLSVTRDFCRANSLHFQEDIGWRCGDYALYVARNAFPDTRYFWLIEYDVRIAAANFTDFFRLFVPYEEIDFIAPALSRRFGDWRWHAPMARCRRAVYGCLFPIIRISAAAIDHLYGARRQASMSKSSVYDSEWPNDEGFVSTELVNAGYRCRDLNSFGRRFYTRGTFSYWRPHQGADFDTGRSDGMVYHPVLYGESYERKLARLTEEGVGSHSPMYWRIKKMRWWPLKWWHLTIGESKNHGFWG